MNWREIIYFDLSTLFSRNEVRENRDERGCEADSELSYTPGRYYQRLDLDDRITAWPGQNGTGSASTSAILPVMLELLALVRCGSPLIPGLESTAREFRHGPARKRSRNTMFLIGLFLTASVIVVSLGNFWIMIAFASMSFSHFGIVSISALLNSNHRNGHLEAIFLVLRRDLAQGYSLSEAMARRNRFFPGWLVAMVAAGEESGRMEEILTEICEKSTVNLRRRNTFKSISTYLIVSILTIFAVAFFCMITLTPAFKEIFSDLSEDLNLNSKILFALYDGLAGHWKVILPLFSISGLILFFTFLSDRILLQGRFSGSILIRIPGIRMLIQYSNLSVICQILEKLLSAGIPLCRSLQIAEESDIFPSYSRMLKRVRKQCELGESFADTIEEEKQLLPRSFRSLAALGFRSGMLPEAFSNLSHYYTRKLDRITRILMNLMQPVSTLLLAAFVFLICNTFFSILIQITESLQS